MSAFTEAVILAGGLGTRLRPVVADRPKGLADVAGRPFLCWQLESLAARGVRRAVMALGYRAEMIRDQLGPAHAGIELHYSLEEEPLGTGGALRKAASLCATRRVLALNGDTFLDFDARRLDEALTPPTAAVIALAGVPDVQRYGTVETGIDGRVTAFHEKGGAGPGRINGGVYALDLPALTGFWPAAPAFSMERDVLPALAAAGLLSAAPADGLFLDIGTPPDLARAQTLFNAPDGRGTPPPVNPAPDGKSTPPMAPE